MKTIDIVLYALIVLFLFWWFATFGGWGVIFGLIILALLY